jgi:A/G-specific adenine glycosylase
MSFLSMPARFFAEPGWPGASRVANKLWAQAESLLPGTRFGDYTQAIMDLGATVCSLKQPQCHRCPVSEACIAHRRGEQDAFPAAKPKKHRPSKSIWMLIAATEEGDYFVEKRPDQGIWGGLHSFPEFASLDALLQWIQAGANQVELTPFKHQFTHYELVIHPVLVRKTTWPALTSAYEGQWINDLERLNIGLSKPAVTLLEQLAGESD